MYENKDFQSKKDFLIKKDCSIENASNIICSFIDYNFKFTFPKKHFFHIDEKKDLSVIPDIAIIWGEHPNKKNIETIDFAYEHKIPVLIVENSFIRSAYAWHDEIINNKFSNGISFIISKTQYFDATKASDIEIMLNNPQFQINDKEKKRARSCINKIVETPGLTGVEVSERLVEVLGHSPIQVFVGAVIGIIAGIIA